LSFFINDGGMVNDKLVILPEDGITTCANAPGVSTVSDGVKVKRLIDANNKIRLPSGSETFLAQGNYFICVCYMNGPCGTTDTGYSNIGASFKVIEQPRLGNLTNPGDVRAVSGEGNSYYIRGSLIAEFAVQTGDRIFFRSSCAAIPSANTASETLQLTVQNFNAATKAGYVSLQGVSLQAVGSTPRVLRACFITAQGLLTNEVFVSDFVTLPDTLTIIPVPRLGPITSPGNLRAVTSSSPTFRLSHFYTGDSFFFGPSCGAVPAVLTTAVYDPSTSSGIFSLPESPKLTSLSTTESRVLKCCFAPARADLDNNAANWLELQDTLSIFPEPISLLTTTFKQQAVTGLNFAGPAGHAGIAGDVVLLQKGNCDNAHLITADSPRLGIDHTTPMTLEAGGAASLYAIAQGKVNELAMGVYKICYATRSSEFDAAADFKTLDTEITITEAFIVLPTLVTPQSVHLGVDIVVTWNATDGQYLGVSEPGSWLGLYKKGECSTKDEWAHECYLAAREVPAGESGGVVRFSQKDYKAAGEYDVRYFRGNTRMGQGQVCQGMRNTGTGVYMQCTLVASTTSDAITVFGRIESEDDLAAVPGLEHVVLV
jgi:hypothetical protein